jgi:hypothetical protein
MIKDWRARRNSGMPKTLAIYMAIPSCRSVAFHVKLPFVPWLLGRVRMNDLSYNYAFEPPNFLCLHL